MRKTAITAIDLLALLEREFERRSARACRACSVALPFAVAPRADGAPNWETVTVSACSLECATLLEELVAELQLAYILVA